MKKYLLPTFVLLILIVIAIWLSSLASQKTPSMKMSPTINSVTFNCANSKSIHAIFFDDKAELTLSDERNLLLLQGISASGARYVNWDESFIFWNKGDSAFVDEKGKMTFDDCVVSK